jgi:hypothetical protein
MDNAQFKAQVAETSRQLTKTTTALTTALRTLGITAGDRAPAVSQSFDPVLVGLAAAVKNVLEIGRLLDGAAAPAAATRACPVCGQRGMAAARLCGHCWNKLTPVTD